MLEFRKTLTQSEIEKGILRWEDGQDEMMRRILPQTLVFDLVFEGMRLDHLSAEWDKRELFIGEPLMKALAGTEVALSPAPDRGTEVVARLVDPSEKILIRKRLSHNEYKNRYLKWFAREDDLYRRLFPDQRPFQIELDGRRIPGQPPNFEKRNLVVGEALRCFRPGDNLLLRWSPEAETPTLLICREDLPSSFAEDARTSLRGLITRLLSRPLSEFNEGEVKGLIVLLDENKNLWERLTLVHEENEKLKDQVATLESVFEQFARNSFFGCKKDFEDWVASHVSLFEKGIRLLHRDYAVNPHPVQAGGGCSGPAPSDPGPFRIDLLCQDRRGLLVAAQILFNPDPEAIAEALQVFGRARDHLEQIANDLSQARLKAGSIRGMVITNRERPDLVEQCLQQGLKLCIVNSGCVIDAFE